MTESPCYNSWYRDVRLLFDKPHCGSLMGDFFITIHYSARHCKPYHPLYTIIEFYSAAPIKRSAAIADNLWRLIISKCWNPGRDWRPLGAVKLSGPRKGLSVVRSVGAFVPVHGTNRLEGQRTWFDLYSAQIGGRWVGKRMWTNERTQASIYFSGFLGVGLSYYCPHNLLLIFFVNVALTPTNEVRSPEPMRTEWLALSLCWKNETACATGNEPTSRRQINHLPLSVSHCIVVARMWEANTSWKDSKAFKGPFEINPEQSKLIIFHLPHINTNLLKAKI